MSSWVYNDLETNGLAKLKPYNGEMTPDSPGAPPLDKLLATTGNALRTVTQTPGVRRIDAAPPGADWTASRMIGLGPRVVTWNWQICAVSEGYLYQVQRRIEAYLFDGRAYTLSNGTLSSSSVQLLDAKPDGAPLALLGGRWLQRWTLQFRVLKARIASGTL